VFVRVSDGVNLLSALSQCEDEDDSCDEAQTHSALIVSAHVCSAAQ